MDKMERQTRAILFDLGGVLVELTGVPTLLSWLENRLSSEELLRTWLSSPAVRSFETGKLPPDVFARRLITEFALPVPAEEFLREFSCWPKTLFPGAMELLRRIPRRYTRATLCNTNELHWPRMMDDLGLGTIFDCHFASHLTGRIKPDEGAFLHVVAALGCKASEVLFLDDNKMNVEVAKTVGMEAERVRGVVEAEGALSRRGIISGSLT